MVVGSVVRPRVIEAAIELFGLYGYEGVNVRELALAANTTTGTIYRLFQSKRGQKDKLYDVVVITAINRALDAVAKAVFPLFDDASEKDTLPIVGQALRRWYEGVGKSEARLLMRVEMTDMKRRELARAPFDKMTNHLAMALARAHSAPKSELHTLSTIILRALSQRKVLPGDNEQSEMEGMVGAFVRMLGPRVAS